ncbi:MAG TPA: zf-HC2 domain-containing protein [Myxococcota bacterium]|nr:zf-HC2 domain-containing protein [Myxococcota bacterium]
MKCSRVRSHLGDHLEGDLDLAWRARVDEHLDRCSDCARELSELRSTVALLRSLPREAAPSELASEVMRRIESGEAPQPAVKLALQRVLDARLVAGLAAGLVAVAILTSVETDWVPASETAARAPSAPPSADPLAIDLWESVPPTLARVPAIEPRLAAIERSAANRFYRLEPRSMAVGFYGRVDPDSQQLDLDAQLDLAKLDPEGFLRQLDQVAEWDLRSRIAPLVVRAGRRGDAQAVASQLRAASHPLAAPLAAEFDRMRAPAVRGNPQLVPAAY